MGNKERDAEVKGAILELDYDELMETNPAMIGLIAVTSQNIKEIKVMKRFVIVQLIFDIVFALIVMGVI